MKFLKLSVSFLLLSLFFTGCLDIAKREDIDFLKEKIDKVETDLYEAAKKIGERFQSVENDYSSKIDKTNEELKKINERYVLLINEINNLKDETKLMRGKIEEINYEYDQKFKKISEEINSITVDVKREIEGLKKAYNDLITTTSIINTNMSSLQSDILKLRDSQIKLIENLKNISLDLEKVEDKITKLEKMINENNKIFLEELTRQESEIINLKKQISDSEKKEGIKEEVKNLKIHIVQKGDTLLKIANKYNTTQEQIKKINNLKSDKIYIGQKLFIP